MSSTRSERRRRAAATLLVLAAPACSVHAPVRHPRPALPVPEHVAVRYALPGPVVEETLVPIGSSRSTAFRRGRIRCGEEIAEFHVLAPADSEPAGFVLCLPVLAGGEDLMWMVAHDIAERGFAVGWTAHVESALSPGQSGRELETLLRRSVLHNRMLLAWARTQPNLRADQAAVLGISMGGMVATALLAVEPDLAGGALCLAGGDLPDLVLRSSEQRVERWIRWRRESEAIADSELTRDLFDHVTSDPALLAGYVDPERVLWIGAAFDGVVPARHQDLLWRSLGRPRRIVLPLTHHTAALAMPVVLDQAGSFFAERFAAPQRNQSFDRGTPTEPSRSGTGAHRSR